MTNLILLYWAINRYLLFFGNIVSSYLPPHLPPPPLLLLSYTWHLALLIVITLLFWHNQQINLPKQSKQWYIFIILKQGQLFQLLLKLNKLFCLKWTYWLSGCNHIVDTLMIEKLRFQKSTSSDNLCQFDNTKAFDNQVS